MPTQVRIFAMPKSLGETLSASTSTTPSSVPTQGKKTERPVSSDLKSRLPIMETIPERPKAGGITFAHQDSLPKLPIPELEHSCKKYLTALKPIQGVREHAETKLAVEEFLRKDGPQLQKTLQEYAVGKTSYIEQFCMF